jgi:hypothetical protein
VAFSISLTLPGSVVFPDEPPIRQLAAPEAPTATVLRAARVVQRPRKAPARPRVVVHRADVPTAGTVPTTSVVRPTQPRTKPPRKPSERAPAPVGPAVAPLRAPPAPVPAPAQESKEADELGDDERRMADRPRKSEKPNTEQPRKVHKPSKSEKPKKAKKPKDEGSGKHDKSGGAGKEDRDDRGDDRRGHDKGKHGGRRGDDGDRG